MCLHTIVLDPSRPGRMYVAISAAGAFRTDDGGATWHPINRGLKSQGIPDPNAEVGHCVHRIAMSGDKIKLQQQAMVGTVSGLSGATTTGPINFTLTVDSDSAFATLSGKTQINVFWQLGTVLHKLASVSSGDKVRVRGLVFFSGTSFNMIARRIDQ